MLIVLQTNRRWIEKLLLKEVHVCADIFITILIYVPFKCDMIKPILHSLNSQATKLSELNREETENRHKQKICGFENIDGRRTNRYITML